MNISPQEVVKVINPIRVVLADDYPVTRAGIRAILESTSDIQVVGEAEDGVEAQNLVAQLRPHILLLDLQMPGPKRSEIDAWVRAHYPETIVLVLTAHNRDAYLAEMVATGVAGYLTKDQSPHQLVAAIRRAARGEILFSREQLARARRWHQEVGALWESLTGREKEILALVAQGNANCDIATCLSISTHTVETHISNLTRKLKLHNRTEIAAWAWEHGFAEASPETG